jgi:hypothetical protein
VGRCIILYYLTSALDGVGGQRHALAAPGKDPVPAVQGAGWAPGPVRKISPPPGFDPRTVQLVVQSLYRRWESKNAFEVQPQPSCFVRKITLRKILPDSEFTTGMAFTTHGKFSVRSPTHQYSNTGISTALKYTEEDILIQNNNSAQFSVTDVHFGLFKWHENSSVLLRKSHTHTHTHTHPQPLHTVTVYCSQTYVICRSTYNSHFYTLILVQCTLQNEKISIYKTVKLNVLLTVHHSISV